MRVDNTATGLSILAACSSLYQRRQAVVHAERTPTESRQVETLFIGTVTQFRLVSSLTSVSVADVDLPVADSMRVLDVTLDRRLTFDNHASAVAQSCNYHARAIRYIRHLLTLDLAQTLACSLILSRIDYCNSVLYGAPSSTIQKLQRVQNGAADIVLQAPRRTVVNSLLQTLHWLPVEQHINYKLAVLTFKTRQTSSRQCLSQCISLRTSARNTLSSSVPLLCVISTDIICQTIVQHCRNSDLEHIATLCVKLRLSLCFQIQT